MNTAHGLVGTVPWILSVLMFCSTPSVHAEEAALAREAARASSPRLRVLTYNIHHGRGTDGQFDYDRLAETISQLAPDVVALQEVDNRTQRSDGVDQAAVLGERLGMKHVFGNALYHAGGRYGEAILSRFPIRDVKVHPLPFRFGAESRVGLAARVIPDNGVPEFVFVGTHLCHQSEAIRLDQVQQLDQLFSTGDKVPVILAGDMNALPTSGPMRVLLDENWVDAVAPKSRIDYILLRTQDPWKVVETIIVDEPIVSDHDPVLTILEWGGTR